MVSRSLVNSPDKFRSAASSLRSWLKPITAFKGVRNSWLTLARNILFALLAASASSLACSSSLVRSDTRSMRRLRDLASKPISSSVVTGARKSKFGLRATCSATWVTIITGSAIARLVRHATMAAIATDTSILTITINLSTLLASSTSLCLWRSFDSAVCKILDNFCESCSSCMAVSPRIISNNFALTSAACFGGTGCWISATTASICCT